MKLIYESQTSSVCKQMCWDTDKTLKGLHVALGEKLLVSSSQILIHWLWCCGLTALTVPAILAGGNTSVYCKFCFIHGSTRTANWTGKILTADKWDLTKLIYGCNGALDRTHTHSRARGLYSLSDERTCSRVCACVFTDMIWHVQAWSVCRKTQSLNGTGGICGN